MAADDRTPPSSLRGRLADVYVPALVSGSVDALTRRLGNRATVDDPVHGRACSVSTIEPLLVKVGGMFAGGGALYTHVRSTTGVDRDASEGMLRWKVGEQTSEIPVAVVAERRRLREIEIRVYYAPPPRAPVPPRRPRQGLLLTPIRAVPLAPLVAQVVDALKPGPALDLEVVLAAFEEHGRVVDPTGRSHARSDGTMAKMLADMGSIELAVGGVADDGRSACVEATMTRRGQEPVAALLAFERGDSGLVRELRLYTDGWS